MMTSYQALAKLLASDPGRRRIPALACPQALAGAASALAQARRVVMFSGFYIGQSGAWETDGPLGTLVLAAALQQVGIEPVIFTDEGALAIFAAGMQAINLQVPLLGFAAGTAPADEHLLQQQPDIVIAIERSGQARDGKYCNANGLDVAQNVAHFDPLFVTANTRGITSIAVGDGGNELGFGSRLREVELLLGETKHIACITPAKYLIACGVSNWGGYALAALVTWLQRSRLAFNQEMLIKMLEGIVAAGAIDGLSGLSTPTVDGLPLTIELSMFAQLTSALPTVTTQVAGETN